MRKGIIYAVASRRIERAEAALAQARLAYERIKKLKSKQKKIRKKLKTSERTKSLASSVAPSVAPSVKLFMNNQKKIRKLEQKGTEQMRLAQQCLLPPAKVNLHTLSEARQTYGKVRPPCHPS